MARNNIVDNSISTRGPRKTVAVVRAVEAAFVREIDIAIWYPNFFVNEGRFAIKL